MNCKKRNKDANVIVNHMYEIKNSQEQRVKINSTFTKCTIYNVILVLFEHNYKRYFKK